jgi:hypothetical protein
MQIKLFYPFRKIVTLLMVMIPAAITAQAQCNAAANHPKPYMWVPKDKFNYSLKIISCV